MEPAEILSLICSIIGLIAFLLSIKIELQILTRVKGLKAYNKWKIALYLTIFFLTGYVINIISILANLTEIAIIFNALVYLFGGLFVLLVVYVSFSTYKAIFEAVDKNEE